MLDQYEKDIQSWAQVTSCKEMSSFWGSGVIMVVSFQGTQL